MELQWYGEDDGGDGSIRNWKMRKKRGSVYIIFTKFIKNCHLFSY